jgi:hypothetical protein
VSYGLSTVASQPNTGVSSLSSIVSYGLSTVSIIGNTVFKSQLIGGIGISSTNCNIGGPDLITAAFKKTDDWLFNNIVGKPPAPTFVSSNLTKQYIAVSWKNPLLYSIGLLNTYIPKITGLLITLSNVTTPSDNIYATPIVNITTEANLPMYATPIQGVQIYNTGSFNSIVTLSGINYKQAVDNRISIGNTYNMYISFSNFNINQNIPMNTLIVPNLSLISAGTPSAAVINAITTTSSNTIGFQWTVPQSNDASDPTASPSDIYIFKYKIAVQVAQIDPFPRRFSGGRDTNIYNDIIIDPGNNYNISGLLPDNSYNITISARNQLNSNYGTSNTFANARTSLPSIGLLIQEDFLGSFFPNTMIYGEGVSFIGYAANMRGNINSYIVYNVNGTRLKEQGFSFQYRNVKIQTESSPGISIPGDIMRVIMSNDLNSSVFLSNGGWTDTNDRSVSACNMTISRTNIQDVYSSGLAAYRGFYQMATYTFTISNVLLMPSQSNYTFYLTLSNFNNKFITQINNYLRFDNISGSPSIHAVSYNGTPPDPTVYICGVASYANTTTFNNYLDMSNLGRYYLAKGDNNEFAAYHLSTGFTRYGPIIYARGLDVLPYIYDTANNIYTSGILPNPARIQTSVTLNDLTNTLFTSSTNNLTLTALPTSLVDVGSLSITTLSNNASKIFYVDLPSIAVILQTNSALNTGINSNGIRVRAVNNAGNIPNLNEIAEFNNSNSLMVSPYSYELQLVNGFYSTSNYTREAYRNYTNYYCNTVNYSTASDPRYVMLSYSNTTPYTGVQRVKFDFTYAPSGAFPIRTDGTNTFNSNITLEYKFISGSVTTGWLDGNSPLGLNGAFNNPPENYKNDTVSGLIVNGTNAITRVLQIPSGNYNGIQLYVRIGIPMTLPCAFSYLRFMGAS